MNESALTPYETAALLTEIEDWLVNTIRDMLQNTDSALVFRTTWPYMEFLWGLEERLGLEDQDNEAFQDMEQRVTNALRTLVFKVVIDDTQGR